MSCRAVLRWIFLLGFYLRLVAAAQATSEVCDALQPRMRHGHIPDVAVAVFAQGKVLSYYCVTGSRRLAADAIFEAASLSKPLFAAAVLTLVQQGMLDLDRPLADYLRAPYQHRQNPFGEGASDTVIDPRFGRLTARMVLTHTSGLPNWSHDHPLTLLADPGESWRYSGEGYIYLQRVVETLTGGDLESFAQMAVLGPLGMKHSSFVWRTDFAGMALLPHAPDGSTIRPAHYVDPLASSTLYTTLDDYSRFVSALLHPKPGSIFAMEETKQVDVNANISLGWGLGVAVEDTSTKAYFHWGANPGFQSFFMVQPASGRGVLFLTDSDQGLDLLDTAVANSIPGSHPVLQFPMLHPKD